MTAIFQPQLLPTLPQNDQQPPHDTPQSLPSPDSDSNAMNPPAQPFQAQGRAQNGRGPQQRHSGEFRNPAAAPMPGANGHGPMPVPAVPVPRGPVGNGQQDTMRGLVGARSPPNGKSEFLHGCWSFVLTDGCPQIRPTCPANSSDKEPARLAKHVHSFIPRP
jgi:hypothetical protein